MRSSIVQIRCHLTNLSWLGCRNLSTHHNQCKVMTRDSCSRLVRSCQHLTTCVSTVTSSMPCLSCWRINTNLSILFTSNCIRHPRTKTTSLYWIELNSSGGSGSYSLPSSSFRIIALRVSVNSKIYTLNV